MAILHEEAWKDLLPSERLLIHRSARLLVTRSVDWLEYHLGVLYSLGPSALQRCHSLQSDS